MGSLLMLTAMGVLGFLFPFKVINAIKYEDETKASLNAFLAGVIFGLLMFFIGLLLMD